ncbi:DUF2846 domain-containing protein [Thalassotalea montiporae]
MKNIIRIFLLTILIGCSASGPKFSPVNTNKDDAVIYIYRVKNLASSFHSSDFYLDDKKVAELDNNGYSFVVVKPGIYKVRQVFPPNWATNQSEDYEGLEIEVKASSLEPVYVEFSAYTKGNMYYNDIKQVSKVYGELAIKNTNYQPLDK